METYHWTLLFIAVCFLCFAIYLVNFRPKRAEKKMIEALRQELIEEEDRLATLPTLDKTYLIKMPDEFKSKFLANTDSKPIRAWGSRYNQLVIFDEVGDVWFGYFMTRTFLSLAKGEFIRGEYYVPIKGGGEAYAGKPFDVDGHTMHVYPLWFNEDTPISDWRRLVTLEAASRATAVKCGDVYKIPAICYPANKREKAEHNRKRLNGLRQAFETVA